MNTWVGYRELFTNTYDNMGRLDTTTYGNGPVIQSTYDILSRVTSVLYNGVTKVAYQYDNDGNVSKLIDSFSGITTEFTYDAVKRFVSMIASNGYELNLRYDDKNRVSEMSESIDGTGMTDKKTVYNYNELGVIDSVTTTQGTSAAFETSYEFDNFYRVEDSTVKVGETDVLTNSYVYEKGQYAGSTTGMVESHTVGDKTYTYTYDVRGNITEISLNGTVIASYTYDEFDRLLTETANGTTTSWTYDLGGNILTRSREGSTINYNYGNSEWKDLLTSYNGKAIEYDVIGNPTSIGTDALTWEAGRRLSSIIKNGITTTFTYDANGYRTAKTTNGVTTTYYLDGSRITAMKVVNAEGSHELSFVYDEKGSIVGLYYNGTPYVYAKNLQGDIIGIVDGTGTWVVNYTYDAWGNPLTTDGTLASTIGTLNPFRYRGYVYDTETGYYYLTSRYYSPEMGRFLNADGYVSTGQGMSGYNMYVYCGNNSVNLIDKDGYRAIRYDANESVSVTIEGLTSAEVIYVLGLSENTTDASKIALWAKRNKNWIENPNKRKGSEDRQPTGERERNVGHPNGEEHSRVPKGNGRRRSNVYVGLGITTVLLLYQVGNDITIIGIADDGAIIPTVAMWWDYMSAIIH